MPEIKLPAAPRPRCARLLWNFGVGESRSGELMKAVSLGFAVSMIVVVSGCATDTEDPCMRRVADLMMPAATESGRAIFETKLPAAQGLFEDANFDKARWVVVDVSTAPVMLPPRAVYAVTLTGEKETAQGERKDACDLGRTYLVVRDGGIGDRHRAFGPLSHSR